MGESEKTKAPVTPEEIKRVKGLGFLHDKRTEDRFSIRVVTGNGRLTSRQLRALAQAADDFGNGEAALTTRLSVELQGVPYEKLEDAAAFLKDYDLEPGGTGPRVRPVVSCKGTVCQYGLIDTYALSEELHREFYQGWHDVKLPHKFKIAVGGCPNNCVKPDLNDVGIVGQRVPAPDYDKCRGCKTCVIESGCPMKAAKKVEGRITVDPELCSHCGRCAGKCPFGVFENAWDGYRIYIGGRWGKKGAKGRFLSRIFTSADEVKAMLRRILEFYRQNGQPGERFADTILRLGFENVEKELLK